VATAILIFTKGGQTDEVWFYDLQNDGYSLDDKRNPVKDNDLPHIGKLEALPYFARAAG
jgi:type I restriction enzyme M protein